MSDVLAQIIARKREEIEAAKLRASESALYFKARSQSKPRGFMRRLQAVIAVEGLAVIAEIKKASPSKGLLRDPFVPAHIANSYAQGGAACLSVLTDQDFFMGEAGHLKEARDAVLLPALRKDFILEPYQVVQSRAFGADCILLIVAALEQTQMMELAQCARELAMDVLVEVHDEAELARALDVEGAMLGINNRNLRTFVTDIGVTTRLVTKVPANRLVVSESGIGSRADLDVLEGAGVHAFLVGETFMRAADPGAALQALIGPNAARG